MRVEEKRNCSYGDIKKIEYPKLLIQNGQFSITEIKTTDRLTDHLKRMESLQEK